MAKTDTKYVLMDDDGNIERFDTEADLEEYLKDQDWDMDELENVNVFSYSKEYRVITNGYELEEVEE